MENITGTGGEGRGGGAQGKYLKRSHGTGIKKNERETELHGGEWREKNPLVAYRSEAKEKKIEREYL